MRHEGLRFKPYRCSANKLTIGYGRNLEDVGISKPEAVVFLDNDIQVATGNLNKALPWVNSLDWPRRGVLINMTFNLGIVGLLKFKNTLRFIQNSEWKKAHDAMLDSKWAQQVGPRAIELARIILTGEMPEEN